ncbi:LuxR C-terminal-related transcriptional regulator [Prauserella muralis]|uniref:LuxR C-terminal-related transcriptional regulator n=1 Tax=Prauserella muralis TaxID=588067 RepID=UPI001474CBC1|nr:LuxR C-terminal-related transcriptional regulator [Prauserella muralis]
MVGDARDRLRAPTSAPKLAVPPLPSGHVHRARLEDLLSRRPGGGQGSPLVTLVCAPAGFGKTTLLASWFRARRRAGAAAAWISVDAHDNDPFVLWSAILNALETGHPTDENPAAVLPRPPQRGEEDRFAAELGDAITRQGREIWVVLDDFHRLTESSPLRSLELLLERFPAGLHLVFSSRSSPPLPLHRFRVTGELREIRTADLRFDESEAAAVLRGHGVSLDQPELVRLMARTEGWPAGLRLAGLALSESHDHPATIGSFVETDRAVADYLVGEVLSVLTADYQEFLLRTSVCDTFTVELASVLTARDDAGALLHKLEQSYGLVSRCSPHSPWFRYHSLLLDYLRAALRRRSLAEARELHRTAAVWFSANDEALTGLRHAISAADEELMVRLVVEKGPAIVLSGQMWTLRRLVEELPRRVAERDDVSAILAVADLSAGDRRTAEERITRLAMVSGHDERALDLRLVALVHHARLTGRMSPEAERLGERLDDIADPDLRMLALVNRGTVLFWLGWLQRAHTDLTRALHLARRRSYDYAVLHCLSHLAGLAGADSDYRRMRATAEEAITFARERGIADSPGTSIAHVAAAWGAYLAFDDDTAEREAETALRTLGASNDRTVELAARSAVAIVRFTREPHDALIAMRECWNAVDPREHAQPALVAYASNAEQRMALRLGRPDWAAEVERRASSWIGRSGDHLLLRARMHALHGRTTTARAQLEKVSSGEVGCLVLTSEIEAHLLGALLASRADDRHAAGVELTTALEKAAAGRVLRPFTEAGPDIRALVAAHSGRLGWAESFVGDVLAAMPAASAGANLSPREVELLRELPSMSTLEEIAGNLYVSVNTVKTHLRSIYRKLGVTTRREAVFTARLRGLL